MHKPRISRTKHRGVELMHYGATSIYLRGKKCSVMHISILP